MWNVCYIDINFSRPVSPDKTCAEECDWVEGEIFAFSLIIILVFIEMWIISWAQAHTAAESLRCFNVSCCVYAAASLMLLEVRKFNILLFAFPFHTLFTAARCLALQHNLNIQHTISTQLQNNTLILKLYILIFRIKLPRISLSRIHSVPRTFTSLIQCSWPNSRVCVGENHITCCLLFHWASLAVLSYISIIYFFTIILLFFRSVIVKTLFFAARSRKFCALTLTLVILAESYDYTKTFFLFARTSKVENVLFSDGHFSRKKWADIDS